MNSSSLFSELAMAFKRTIPLNLPNPYQASQSQKSDSSSSQKHPGNGTSSSNMSLTERSHASSHSAPNDRKSDDCKSVFEENIAKEDTVCPTMVYDNSISKDIVDDNLTMQTDIVDGITPIESMHLKLSVFGYRIENFAI